MHNTDDTTTIHTLTVEQLENAAADLRNSSVVLEQLGRTTGQPVDPASGEVCAVGAVEAATTRQLVSVPAKMYEGAILHKLWPVTTDADVMDHLSYRANNAFIVLAEVIPVDLCDNCADTELTCPDCEGNAEPRGPWEIITHYNDNHCMGDAGTELLHGLFALAADRALVAAAEKRSFIGGGRLLATV